MKEYYYLDINRKVCGPHSVEELAAMLMAGSVAADTEVASPGDARWVFLGSVVTREQVSAVQLPPVPAVEGAPGKCPSCNTELKLADGALPAKCPACGRVLRAKRGGFWENLLLPLRLYAKFSGRATRAEFWTFSLVYTFALCACIIGGLIVAMVALCNEQRELLIGACAFIMLTWIVSMLLFILPLSAVQVRRLHDAGFSGWWLGAAWLCNLVYLVVYHVLCYDERQQMKDIIEEGIRAGGESALNAIQTAMEMPASPAMLVSSMFSLLSQILFLVIFALSFCDSQRGPNKYGPSSKYPMG